MDYRTHQRQAALAAGEDLRAVVRAVAARRRAARRVHARRRRRLAPQARDARGGREVGRHLARERDDPGLPRGVRRRRLPAHVAVRDAEGRHRRVHDLRGRQHDPAPAGGEEPADRLQGRVRRARPARDGAVRRRAGARRADRAHGAAQARRLADPRPRRRRRPARPQDPAGAVPLALRAPAGGCGAAAEGRDRRGQATRSASWSTARTTWSRPRARGSTWSSWRRSRSRSATSRCWTSSARCTRCTRSRPSAATTRSTAG